VPLGVRPSMSLTGELALDRASQVARVNFNYSRYATHQPDPPRETMRGVRVVPIGATRR
jgi:hypothetical protein